MASAERIRGGSGAAAQSSRVRRRARSAQICRASRVGTWADFFAVLWPLAPSLPCPALPCWSEFGVPRLDFTSPVVLSCLIRSSKAGRARPYHTSPSSPVCSPFPVRARWSQLPNLSVEEPGRPPASGSRRTKPSAALDRTAPDLKLYWRLPGPAHREGSQAVRTVRLNPWSGAANRSCHLPPTEAKDLGVLAPKRTQGLLLPQSPASRDCR